MITLELFDIEDQEWQPIAVVTEHALTRIVVGGRAYQINDTDGALSIAAGRRIAIEPRGANSVIVRVLKN